MERPVLQNALDGEWDQYLHEFQGILGRFGLVRATRALNTRSAQMGLIPQGKDFPIIQIPNSEFRHRAKSVPLLQMTTSNFLLLAVFVAINCAMLPLQNTLLSISIVHVSAYIWIYRIWSVESKSKVLAGYLLFVLFLAPFTFIDFVGARAGFIRLGYGSFGVWVLPFLACLGSPTVSVVLYLRSTAEKPAITWYIARSCIESLVITPMFAVGGAIVLL